jgi:hypothetical protein
MFFFLNTRRNNENIGFQHRKTTNFRFLGRKGIYSPSFIEAHLQSGVWSHWQGGKTAATGPDSRPWCISF